MAWGLEGEDIPGVVRQALMSFFWHSFVTQIQPMGGQVFQPHIHSSA